MPIRTSFVIPSWYYWTNPIKQQPLTQLYLATLLDENVDVTVDLIDLRGSPDLEIPERDIYFYSITSPDFFELISLCSKIRKKYPNSKHIAGGVHVSFYPQETKKYFDSVVIGDAEELLDVIVKDYKKGELLPFYQKKSKQFYAIPQRLYLPIDRVVSSLFKSKPNIKATMAFFSKGCPFLCGFCANYEPHKLYRKTTKSITEEINYLKSEYGIEGISLSDDICIPQKESQANEYLEIIGQAKISWRGLIRAGVPKNILLKARKAGFIELALGVESVSPEVLMTINKGIDVATLKKTIKDCKDSGIWVQISIINGLPNEPQNIVEMTKSFIEEVVPDSVLLCSLVVYPGSPFFIYPEKYGMKDIDNNYSKFQIFIGRFRDADTNRENRLNFKYEKGFSEEQILEHLFQLQDFLINAGYNK